MCLLRKFLEYVEGGSRVGWCVWILLRRPSVSVSYWWVGPFRKSSFAYIMRIITSLLAIHGWRPLSRSCLNASRGHISDRWIYRMYLFCWAQTVCFSSPIVMFGWYAEMIRIFRVRHLRHCHVQRPSPLGSIWLKVSRLTPPGWYLVSFSCMLCAVDTDIFSIPLDVGVLVTSQKALSFSN